MPAVMVDTCTPDLHVEYFRDLRDLLADGKLLSAEHVAPVLARCATELSTGYASE
ncbi:MAG: hypothetical protein ABWY11_13640 [Umezawaea sp.]